MFDTPSAGSSPVPAGYGSLGGGLPRERVDGPERIPRERKPFRWKVWREEPEDGAGPLDDDRATEDRAPSAGSPPAARADRPVATPRNRPAARTGSTVATPRRRPTDGDGLPRARRVATAAPAAPPDADRPSSRARTVVHEEDPGRPARRTRVVPAVPRQRLDLDGRVLVPSRTTPPEPEPRPATFLKETIRTRQVVRHVEPWSVLRVSFLFYLLGMIVTLLAGVALWNVASALGTITSIDKSIKTLFDLKTFTLRPAPVLAYSLAGGAVLVVIGTLVNVMIAVVFNLISDVTGGLAVRVVSRPDDD